MTSPLAARDLRIGYDGRIVVPGLSLDIPDGGFTVVVGPNACGKSTLLRALARTIRPVSGEVLLDDRPFGSYRSKEVARRLAMLPQSPIAPEEITVEDLVARGRYPHQGLLQRRSAGDEDAVARAMAATEVTALASRRVADLSGGQRQRVWIAMVLAQDTGLLLLDEPTTFLDIAHQYDVLDLCGDLHAAGRTLVVVLHDLGQAARYATNLVVMKDGAVVAEGAPATVLTEALVRDVFGIESRVIPDPETGTPLVIPLAASTRRRPREG
jgi:iron complex transport system ATP-binding protein